MKWYSSGEKVDAFYLHNNKISFKKIDEGDLEDLLQLKNESWSSTVNTACLNTADQKRWFEKISNDKTCLFFSISELSENQTLALKPQITTVSIGLFGLTSIDPINHSCEFTHSIYAIHRGKGLGKASLKAGIQMAFEVFNIRRIETWILESNIPEIKIVKGLGFREEGAKRQAVYKSGKYQNCILFGLLREEWDLSQRAQ